MRRAVVCGYDIGVLGPIDLESEENWTVEDLLRQIIERQNELQGYVLSTMKVFGTSSSTHAISHSSLLNNLTTQATLHVIVPPKLDVTPYDVLSFWFGGDTKERFSQKWFPQSGSSDQQSMDSYITTRFASLLSRAEAGHLSHWESSPMPALALIITLDQFSRHIHRASPDRIRESDAHALRVSELVCELGWDQLYTPSQLCFALMPQRHTPTVQRLQAVMGKVEAIPASMEADGEVLKRFRRATMRRLQDLEGRVAEREPEHDILELHPFVADEGDMGRHVLVKTISAFLKTHHDSLQHGTLAVSLSGGVDSMVIAKILAHLAPSVSQPPPKLLAIHIDYANRVESGAEARFVEEWAGNLGFQVNVRRIDEVTRGITKRDEYEQVSRDIRYDTYKSVLSEHRCAGIFFGHHQGDLQENVISNAMKGVGILGLAGMSETSVNNGVCICRPLLPHHKHEIFAFAHQYGVPFFKDTTPKWSNRGKMRNQLLPLLADIFGDGFLGNLSSLGQESTELSQMVHQSLFAPFLSQVNSSAVGVWVDCADVLDQSIFFWKSVFKHICHTMLGESMIREKPLETLIERMCRTPPFTGWITLRRSCNSYISNGSTVVLFSQHMFPKTPYFQRGQVLDIRVGGSEVRFCSETPKGMERGLWRLTLSELPHSSGTPPPNTPRSMTLFDVLSGDLQYAIPNTPPFMIQASTKHCPQLPGVEKIVKEAIPIVVGTGEGEGEEGWVLARLRFERLPQDS